MSKIKFSKFVHFFERKGIVAVFHALSRKIIFVSRKNLQSMKKLPRFSVDNFSFEAIDYFKKNGFVISNNDNESRKLAFAQRSILQRPCIDTLYLLLTDNCNFACRYCFFEGSYGEPKEKTINMTKNLAIAAVRKFANYLKKANEYPDFKPYESSIVFYGGEPLINSDVFFAAVEEVVALKKSGQLPRYVAMNINTNGSLITPKIASFCAKHGIEVDVSLDGYKKVHDACRIWRGKSGGTYEDVMKGIAILKAAGAKICISCTVSEANVDELPKIFNWFLDGAGISNIGFNPLLNSYQYRVKSPEYSHKVASAMIKCFKIARKRGIYEARMMRKVRAFVEGQMYDRDCCGCGKQIVVLPDGKIGVCHAYSGTKQFFVEPYGEFDPYQHPFWKEWSRRSPLNMPQCHGCEALTICGGGCPHNADMNKGSIWELDEHFCVHAKETLQWLIWDLYEKAR